MSESKLIKACRDFIIWAENTLPKTPKTMYYITKKTSDTGKKFAEVNNKMIEAFNSRKEFCVKHDIKTFRGDLWAVEGGLSAIIFEDNITIDPKIWKNVNSSKNEWMPRLNTKAGKEFQKKIDLLPTVSRSELNSCINWDGRWSHIGFQTTNSEYYGFTTNEKWDLTIPEDCEEVTSKRYKELFKK